MIYSDYLLDLNQEKMRLVAFGGFKTDYTLFGEYHVINWGERDVLARNIMWGPKSRNCI